LVTTRVTKKGAVLFSEVSGPQESKSKKVYQSHINLILY
jgi:hypothetical protein